MTKKKGESAKAKSKKSSKKNVAAGKKKAAAKSGTKGKGTAAAKGTAAKQTKAALKPASKKAAAKSAFGLSGQPGMCLDLSTSDQIVEDAVRRAAPGISNIDFENTLEDHSIFTLGQRTVFRQDVFQRVLNSGCEIGEGQIPNEADSVLRDISATIKARAR